ncbi:lysozyme [Fibrisoma limi]|uniref:lysozyme n=1 Tax=Fibrisoma limi TaxID=663275 RepID=UPI000586DB99
MNNLQISPNGIDFIKNEEGCKLKAYRDVVGVWTIGIGHTGFDVTPGKVITYAEALRLLDNDLDKFEAAVNRHVTKPLTQHQFDSLVSLSFNIGVSAFAGSTLLKLVNINPNNSSIRAQFMRWTKGTVNGKKIDLTVLVARRKREADLYFR